MGHRFHDQRPPLYSFTIIPQFQNRLWYYRCTRYTNIQSDRFFRRTPVKNLANTRNLSYLDLYRNFNLDYYRVYLIDDNPTMIFDFFAVKHYNKIANQNEVIINNERPTENK